MNSASAAMERDEFKLKQAAVVAEVPPKELQNLVQFKVVRPKRRGRAYWFDRETLLQAKCHDRRCSRGYPDSPRTTRRN